MTTSLTNSFEGLNSLREGAQVIFQNGKVTRVSRDIAEAFRPGDRLVAIQKTGEIKLVPSFESRVVESAVSRALDGFGDMQSTSSHQVGDFFDHVARLLADDATWSLISQANKVDVERTLDLNRPVGRLLTTNNLRKSMIAGIKKWKQLISSQDKPIVVVDHDDFRVEVLKAPLGVIGFVFEGRPNVLIDACGVLTNGNSVVFRIGSDSIETARSIMQTVIGPALELSGLPEGAITMVDSTSHASAWALFGDNRISLAVIRGSGEATITLGAIAMQQGTPVSLHGTGGAWIVVSSNTNETAVEQAVITSLDRKVCNTLNTLCIVRSVAEKLVPVIIRALADHHKSFCIHVVQGGESFLEGFLLKTSTAIGVDVHSMPMENVGIEWEWEDRPEISLVLVDNVDEGIEIFNKYSPRFVVSLLSDSIEEQQYFYDRVEAPFVGDGYTRWVDGQLALNKPELGLSNWQFGRLFSRGGILTGDSVYSIRTRYHRRS